VVISAGERMLAFLHSDDINVTRRITARYSTNKSAGVAPRHPERRAKFHAARKNLRVIEFVDVRVTAKCASPDLFRSIGPAYIRP
jgi:hypothetical protein